MRRATVVVALADDLGRQDVRRRRERVDGRVDAERRDLPGELGGRVEVGERRERRGVGVVVGGHVDGLQRRDRTTLGRGDALLELAHLVGERRLVTHCRSACGRAASTPRSRPARTGRCCRRTAARPGSSRRGSTRRSSARSSATRRRTPGGSSIWPYTSAAFSMTPDSCISIQRSVPSRVRSPTPANTDTPPCCCATRLIISWMNTVLPTPAPPNRPILPPCTYGSRRSMTLMPVSNICALGLELVEGAARHGGSPTGRRCR